MSNTSLGKLLKYRKGRPPLKDVGMADVIPVLTPDYLRNGVPSEFTPRLPGQRLMNSTELVLLWDGSNAGEFFRARPGSLGSTMVAFEFNRDDLDSDYLYYELKRFEPTLKAKTAGSGIPHVDKEVLLGHEIRKPKRSQQTKIAEILATVDRAIALTDALLAKQQRVKAGLMQELLTRGIDADGNRRDPRTHAFKDSPLGPIPVEWEVGRLETKKGVRPYLKTGPFGTQLKGEHWVDEGVPVITIGSLGEGLFIETELLFITPTKAKSLAACSVLQGDLVFSRVADVGRSVVVGPSQNGWIMSSNLMRISLDKRLAVSEYVHASIVFSHFTRQQLRASVNASGREVANTPILDQLLFAWPSFEEQQRITKIIDVQQKSSYIEQANYKKLQSLKAGLMQDLLTGQVSVLPLLNESK